MAQAIARVFYRFDAVGSAPVTGPLLLLPNHPNALLDPALIIASAGRPVRFLAKSTLFRGPLAPLLHAAESIPVFRKQDEGADVSRNTETFAAVDAALGRGDAICIFPEGISHSSGRLEPLRTGAARMALSARSRGIPVQLVPIGINPERKMTFRSRMTIVYGRAFDVPAEMSVPELTAEITERMRHLIVEADPVADAGLVIRVDQLYAAERRSSRDVTASVARRRVIAEGLERLRGSDPEWYESALLQLRRYDQRLRRFGLRDRALDWDPSARDAVRFVLKELPLAILLVPVAAVAVVVFFVPYVVTAAVAGLQRETDVTASAKVIAGTIFYAAWTLFLAALAGWRLGSTAGLLTLAALPPLAAFGLFALERESAAIRTARSWLALRGAHRATRQRLRRHRAELADVLDEVNRWLASTTEETQTKH